MPGINGGTLRAWRRARGWDVSEVARQLRHAAREAGVDVAAPAGLVRMIYAWERGDHEPSERYELLYRALGFVPPAASWPAGADNADAEEEDVDRREFQIAALGLLAGTLVPARRVSGAVTAAHAAQLQAVADDLWIRDWAVSGAALLREAVTRYTDARAMLDDGSYTSQVGGTLQAATAELAAFAGWAAFDAGTQELARALLTEAAILAAGEPVLSAHVYAMMALQSISLARSGGSKGRAREALRFLAQAADVARHERSPRLHAMIWMRRATAAAVLEDDREVRYGIVSARRELDRGDHPADPHWAGFVTPAEVTGHEAAARSSQGRHADAARLFRDVLGDPGLPLRNHVLYQARLAASLAAAGDSGEADAEGLRVLEALAGPVRSARILRELGPVRERAAPGSEFAGRFDLLAAS